MLHVYLHERDECDLELFPVWQKLEEENQEFFQAYYLRLIVKDQIQRFNGLLHRQLETMQIYQAGSSAISDGSQIRPSKI